MEISRLRAPLRVTLSCSEFTYKYWHDKDALRKDLSVLGGGVWVFKGLFSKYTESYILGFFVHGKYNLDLLKVWTTD